MTKENTAKAIKMPKEAKPAKPNINYTKLVRKFIARPIAFVTLFVFASYGVRHALSALQDPMQVGLTILFTLGLAYILFSDWAFCHPHVTPLCVYQSYYQPHYASC